MAARKETAAPAPEENAMQPVQQEELVEIRLFKDNNKYKDDVYVGLNGRGYLIKRGQTVRVPRAVYEIIENSRDQDEYTARLIEQESTRYENESRARGL